MALTDGAVAVLAQQAAELVGTDVAVHVRPSANDDPYRWGGHGWVVRIGADIEVWVPADASEADVLERLSTAVRAAEPRDPH